MTHDARGKDKGTAAVLAGGARWSRWKQIAPVSWFSRKVTAREGHMPMRPGGRPWLSTKRQYSRLPIASCRMPAAHAHAHAHTMSVSMRAARASRPAPQPCSHKHKQGDSWVAAQWPVHTCTRWVHYVCSLSIPGQSARA